MNPRMIFSSFLVAGLVLTAGGACAAPDWSKVPVTAIHVFHPGATPFQWIQSKGKHGGSRGLARGESCAGCHVEGGEINVDLERIAKELEPAGAPKVRSYPVQVQAAYDANQLYVRLRFKAPDGGFDHSDKDNALKATLLFPDAQVPLANQVGCWASCHEDARTMPGAKESKSKYVTSGGYDLMQWSSNGQVSDGRITDQRRMQGGGANVKAEGSFGPEGWTITFSRKLAGATPMVSGQPVNFGLAIHADHAGGRFHHVSFGHTIGLDGEGDVKAQKF